MCSSIFENNKFVLILCFLILYQNHFSGTITNDYTIYSQKSTTKHHYIVVEFSIIFSLSFFTIKFQYRFISLCTFVEMHIMLMHPFIHPFFPFSHTSNTPIHSSKCIIITSCIFNIFIFLLLKRIKRTMKKHFTA